MELVNTKNLLSQISIFNEINKDPLDFEFVEKNTINYHTVKMCGRMLRYVDKTTKNYKEICLEAVKNDGYAIEFCELDDEEEAYVTVR